MPGYNKREIEAILKSKIDEWLQTIHGFASDGKTGLSELIRDHYIITGGAIVSLLQGEPPNDYDVFLDSVSVAQELVQYYLKKLKLTPNDYSINLTSTNGNVWKLPNGQIKPSVPGSISVEIDEGKLPKNTSYKPAYFKTYYGKEKTKPRQESPVPFDYQVEHITTNAITLTGDIQIITKQIGNPMEIHRSFDFLHCVSYYSEASGLVTNRYALECILTKELKYIGSQYPIDSFLRMNKFIQRGWTISPEELLKIVYDASQTLTKTSPTFLRQLLKDTPKYKPFLIALENLSDQNHDLNRTKLFDLLEGV